MTTTYNVKLTGLTPLLLHRDNIDFADDLKVWRAQPDNKKLSVAGDDRSPAFTWLGCLYDDGVQLTMPSDNLMSCIMAGGAAVPVPGGRGGKTFKAQTQSGLLTTEANWTLLVDGKPISLEPLYALKNNSNFRDHQATVLDYGFSLFVKRAAIGTSKHVRVRPRFPRWELQGNLDVWDDQLTLDVLRSILRMAGEYKGLGDWRPSSKTPGPYGRFSAEVQKN